MDRAVIKCPGCRLNQYMTKSGNCRRCNKLLKKPFVIPIFTAVIQSPVYQIPWTVKDLGKTVRFWRTFFGMSQIALAKRLHHSGSHGYISRIENEEMSPTIGYIERIAQALDISVSWLMQHPTHEMIDFKIDSEIVRCRWLVGSPLARKELLEELRYLSCEKIRQAV